MPASAVGTAGRLLSRRCGAFALPAGLAFHATALGHRANFFLRQIPIAVQIGGLEVIGQRRAQTNAHLSFFALHASVAIGIQHAEPFHRLIFAFAARLRLGGLGLGGWRGGIGYLGYGQARPCDRCEQARRGQKLKR